MGRESVAILFLPKKRGTMKRHDMMSSFLIFCFGLFIVLYSPHFNLGSLRRPGSGFMPFLTGVMICAFSTITFLQAFFHKSDEVEKIWAKVKFQTLISVILVLIGYPFLMKLLGFIICSFFMILVIMRYAGYQTWTTSVLGAALSSILSYLLFETWLKGQLPKGILGF